MLHRRLLPLGSVTLGLWLVAVVLATGRADDITLVPGSTYKGAVGGHVRGDIQKETPKEVVVKLGAVEQSVPMDQIAAISYSNPGPDFVLAESKENAGALVEAADLYKKAAAAASDKPFVQQAALFHQADVTADLALADPAKAAEATSLLSAFVKNYPTSRHVVSALESLARLQLNQGDYAGVDKTLAEMAKQPQSAERASVFKAKVFAKKGDHAKALSELETLIKGSKEGSVQQREARLAKAESLVALNKYAEAETEAKAVIKELPTEDAQGQSAAYNTLGDCLRAAGKPKDALMAYLHTDILYNKDKEQHPRALAHIAQLWKLLKQEPRAEEVIQKLKQEYPSSPWVATALGTAK